MIVISKKGIERRYNDKTRVILELRGLSTDTKPTDEIKAVYIDNGSVYIEIDTGNLFMLDLEHEEWKEI